MKSHTVLCSYIIAALMAVNATAQGAVPTPSTSAAQVQLQPSEKGISTVPGQNTDPGAAVRQPLPAPKNPKLATLYLIGDSTVRNGKGDGASGQWGWGEPLVGYFDLDAMNVVNRAIGGRSSRTYITEGRWDELLALLKPGDFVILQFGHNDPGPLDDTARARGTLPGVGEESKDILQSHNQEAGGGPHLWLVYEEVCYGHTGQGSDPHCLLADPSQDLEGRKDRAQCR